MSQKQFDKKVQDVRILLYCMKKTDCELFEACVLSLLCCIVFVMFKVFVHLCFHSLCKKTNIHQVTTMLATANNVVFPGHNHLLTIGTDDPSL